MSEQKTTEIQEREFANHLLAWFQGDDDECPQMFTSHAKQRLEALGITGEQLHELRSAMHVVDGPDQIPLWLYFSGFSVGVLAKLLGEGCEEAIGESIEKIGVNNPGLFQDYEPLPSVPIQPEMGAVALQNAIVKPGASVRPVRRPRTAPVSRRQNSVAEEKMKADEGQDDFPADTPDAEEVVKDDGIVIISRRRPNVDDDEDAAAAVLRGPAASPDLVKVYLNEIGKTPLLDAEQEVILSKRIEAGLYARRILDGREVSALVAERGITLEELEQIAEEGEEAKMHMVQANLRLVVSIARRSQYQGKGLGLLDLISEGNTGLFRAVEKFDFAKGYKFSTYATWWIAQAVSRGLANTGDTIRLPVHTKELVYKVQGARSRLLQENGYEPSVEALANECNVTQERVIDIIRIAKPILSLDQELNDRKGDPGDTERVDLIAAPGNDFDDMIHNQLNADVVRQLLGVLDLRTANMVSLRHGLIDGKAYTLDEIGAAHHLTRERVRQLLDKGMTKLRGVVVGTSLLDHLDR